MDHSAQPSFTRRMLTRANSWRNREKGCLRFDDLKRKLSILQAIDDASVSIEDTSDSHTTDGHVVIGGNVFVRDKRKRFKHPQRTSSDSQITRSRTVLSDSFLTSKYSTSHLTDPVKSNVWQNTHDLKGTTSDVNQHERKDSYSINQEEKTNEDQNSKFHSFEAKSSSECNKKALNNDHESYYGKVGSLSSEHGDPSHQLLLRSSSNVPEPTVNINETENMYAQVRKTLKKSTIAADKHENNIENSVDLLRTVHSSSIEVISESTKDSLSHSIEVISSSSKDSSFRSNEVISSLTKDSSSYSTEVTSYSPKDSSFYSTVVTSNSPKDSLSRSIETISDSPKDSSSRSSYVEGFTLGNVKWRGPLCNAFMPRSKAYEYSGSDPQTRERNDTRSVQPTEAKLLTVEYKQIQEPPKMKPELRTIVNRTTDMAKNEEPSDLPRDASAQTTIPHGQSPLNVDITYSKKEPEHFFISELLDDSSMAVSPLPSLTLAIKELETEIDQLDLEPNFSTPKDNIERRPSSRLYSNLSKINAPPNGYMRKTLYETFCIPDKPEVGTTIHSGELNTGESTTRHNIQGSISEIETIYEDIQPYETIVLRNIPSKIDLSNQNTGEIVEYNSVTTNFTIETPRNILIRPSLESTRKSSCCDELKHTIPPSYIGSAFSSIPVSSKTPESLKTDENFQRNLQSTSAVQTDLNATIPDEVKRFLEDALGDEFYNTTVTYPSLENPNLSISQYNVSELMSQEMSLFYQKKMKLVNETPVSMSPNVTTRDRKLMLYGTLTQRIKNKLRPESKSPPTQESMESTHFSEPSRQQEENIRLRALLQEAYIQQTLMYQANKALTLCRSMKEFHASTEQVESERLLLVAGLKKAATLEEIKKLAYELNSNEVYYERGDVTLQNFSLPLRTDTLACETQTGDFVYWVVLVVSEGSTVWATPAKCCTLQSARIDLHGSIQLRNLTPDFKILVRVYTLKLRRSTLNYEEKYHLNRDERNTRCPSPKKLLKKTDRQLSPRSQSEGFAIRNTSFVLSGMVELHLHDLTMKAPWPLSSLTPGSILRGTIDVNLHCRLYLSISHSGFLTHGAEAGGSATWNRRWCVLQGYTLMLWNYPCDQDTKAPLVKIHLTNCVSNIVTVANRSLCARPRTLLIETARRRNKYDRNSLILQCRLSCTIVRNLLSCDTIRDMDEWMAKLNRVISALREWNITSPPPQVQVSEL